MSHVAALYQSANQPMNGPSKTNSGGKFAPVSSQIGPICLEKQGKHDMWQRSKRDIHIQKPSKTMTHIEHESMNVNEHAMELTSGKFRERVNQEMNTWSSILCSVL